MRIGNLHREAARPFRSATGLRRFVLPAVVVMFLMAAGVSYARAARAPVLVTSKVLKLCVQPRTGTIEKAGRLM